MNWKLFLREERLFICDFENEPEIEKLGRDLNEFLGDRKLNGILHSIAFANYEEGLKPFHQTKRKDFYKPRKYLHFLSLNYQESANHASMILHLL